ncbi:hypothetical protein AX14_013787 [Amanita brunnescens Koide BX004]|nr:hypothetical protein AX14_013787 [Amanita brunnescens Koide BX004]
MDSANSALPVAPTQGLPKLAFLSGASTADIKSALDNLQALYFSAEKLPPIPDELSRRASKALCNLATQPKAVGTRLDGNATPVPDSGYASAEEDEDREEERMQDQNALSVLRADPFERAYALKWLTGFVGRSDIWLSYFSSEDDELERTEVVEEAAKLISAFSDGVLSFSPLTGDKINNDETDGSIVRSFSFLIPAPRGLGPAKTQPAKSDIIVRLNDAPLSSSDHTSVGLQSWGSSIILAERLCADPAAFSILPKTPKPAADAKPLRVLELGAGTGLLSITASKIAVRHSARMTIAATDYHPHVLTNLASNVAANANASSSSASSSRDRVPTSAMASISVHKFDWEHPDYRSPPFDAPFDIILAADVVYHPLHAAWIKSCVEELLLKPGLGSKQRGENEGDGGVFWLMIPIRTTGRHEGMHRTVESVFSAVLGRDGQVRERGEGGWELVILEMEVVAKREGTGRADESEYRLYKIGWALNSK